MMIHAFGSFPLFLGSTIDTSDGSIESFTVHTIRYTIQATMVLFSFTILYLIYTIKKENNARAAKYSESSDSFSLFKTNKAGIECPICLDIF